MPTSLTLEGRDFSGMISELLSNILTVPVANLIVIKRLGHPQTPSDLLSYSSTFGVYSRGESTFLISAFALEEACWS